MPRDEHGDQRAGGGAVGAVRSAADTWDRGWLQRVLLERAGGAESEAGR